jgi:hypothetical protein
MVLYAQPIVPGGLRFLDSVGDDTNALLTLTVTMAGGPFGQVWRLRAPACT